jgi:nitroreductase
MERSLEDRRSVTGAILGRRAVRAYTDEMPVDAVIRSLLDAAIQAPTAMHEEQWAFAVMQSKAALKRYSDRAKSMMIEDARHHIDLLPRPSSQRDRLAMIADPAFNIFYDAGTLIVICRKSTGTYVEADCWLAAENLMLAAYAQGLGTCCIGFAIPVLNTPEAKRDLGIPDNGAAVVPIIVGVPRGTVAPVARKPPEILRWIK